jgi:Tfp pilus assembly protein PilO
VAALAAGLISTPPRLPGAALGSVLLLRVEWALALFAALLLAIVVLVRAWYGLLPSEISGRGVRYAEAYETQTAVNESAAALEGLKVQVAALAHQLAKLQTGDDPAKRR